VYIFKKISLDNRVLLVIMVIGLTSNILNFCTIVRTRHLLKNEVNCETCPIVIEELSTIKKQYYDSLTKLVSEYEYVYVDISNGDIITPLQVSEEQILGEYKDSLPF
jgi:hypothetical protein